MKIFRIIVEASWEATHNEVAEREVRPDLDKLFGQGEYQLLLDDQELLPDLPSWLDGLLDGDTSTLEQRGIPPAVSSSTERSTTCKTKRYTREQIIAVMKEAMVAGKAREDEVLRQHGVSARTYRRWKPQFMEAGTIGAGQLKQLKEENTTLKRVVAEQTLEIRVLRDTLGKE